jgi:hypothetical protein
MRLGVDTNALGFQHFGVFESLDYAAGAGLDTVQLHRAKLASPDEARYRAEGPAPADTPRSTHLWRSLPCR